MKQIAIITGAAGDIGRAIVEIMTRNNITVVAADIDQNGLEKLQYDMLRNENLFVDTFTVDVSKRDGIDALVKYAMDKYHTIDILVNAAGIDLWKMITETSDEEWHKVMDTNLYSAFALTRAVAPIMIEKQKGHIINVSSVWGQEGASMEVVYSITKGGIDALTKGAAKEFGPSNVIVNAVSPGFIDTKMNGDWTEEEKVDVIEDIPLSRMGMPEEVAHTVMFLAETTYISGQVLSVNGAWFT